MKQEAKLVYLLECLQKTPPPVLIFAEKTKDVDDIHEYLMVKVMVVALLLYELVFGARGRRREGPGIRTTPTGTFLA